MSTRTSSHARDLFILRAGVVAGFAALVLSCLIIVFTRQSMLTTAVLGIGSFLAVISPGWALLTLHEQDETLAARRASAH